MNNKQITMESSKINPKIRQKKEWRKTEKYEYGFGFGFVLICILIYNLHKQ